MLLLKATKLFYNILLKDSKYLFCFLIQILIQKFEGFLSTIHSNEDRVANLENAASTLVKENHPESEKILAKSSEISHLWEELKECAQSRQEVFCAFNFFLLYIRSR